MKKLWRWGTLTWVWERRGRFGMRCVALGLFLFVFVGVLWAADGPEVITSAGEWLRTTLVAVASAFMGYGAMHVRVAHLERDMDRKADHQLLAQHVEYLQQGHRDLQASLADIREEVRVAGDRVATLLTELHKIVSERKASGSR